MSRYRGLIGTGEEPVSRIYLYTTCFHSAYASAKFIVGEILVREFRRCQEWLIDSV